MAMKKGIYANNFAVAFSRLLEETKVTCYQIEQYTGINQGYLSHLKSGERQNPSPETMIRIAIAIAHLSDKVTLHDIENLFNSVGRTIMTRH
jgi:transcriptional regulator with XRE-family HTH domain